MANIPFRSRRSYGQITVDYKKYGVGLAFTPTVLTRGLINMKIEPEVSQIDTNPNSYDLDGKWHHYSGADRAPRLDHGRAARWPELYDRRPAADATTRTTIDQLPWLGDVPVLGALFSSKSYQNNQTDLVIIVTPHIVRPARPGDVVRAPTDDTVAAE